MREVVEQAADVGVRALQERALALCGLRSGRGGRAGHVAPASARTARVAWLVHRLASKRQTLTPHLNKNPKAIVVLLQTLNTLIQQTNNAFVFMGHALTKLTLHVNVPIKEMIVAPRRKV